MLPGSPAEKAGVKQGDIFLRLDGQVIAAGRPEDAGLFDNLIRAYRVGATVELAAAVRAKKRRSIALAADRRPKPNWRNKDDRFEFTVREISFNKRVEAEAGHRRKGRPC